METNCEIEKFNENNFQLCKIKAILRKDNCTNAIEERTMDITNQKWKEINDTTIANFHFAM